MTSILEVPATGRLDKNQKRMRSSEHDSFGIVLQTQIAKSASVYIRIHLDVYCVGFEVLKWPDGMPQAPRNKRNLQMALRSVKKSTLAAACPAIQLHEELGAGGNGRVFAGTCKTHGQVAVKFLLNADSKRYHRFRDEVLVVTTRLAGSARVVPIHEHDLPTSLQTDSFPWYVMPKAQRLTHAVELLTMGERLAALVELADGLAEIHQNKVAHRDIKPDNLFMLDGTYRFGDFGIAAFPGNAGVTSVNEPMGPAGYMAPEMLKSPTTSDPFSADVYSFAKTVWAVLSGEKFAFGGHYDASTAVGLSNFVKNDGFIPEPVDAVIEQSTRFTPSERPSAQAFATKLREALDLQKDFRRSNPLQWEAAELQALRGAGPVRSVWQDATEIARVIGLLSRRSGLNHCFLPGGGGLEVEGATVCESNTMLSLEMQLSSVIIVKPLQLTLERFPARPDFSYAVLETADTAPLGVAPRYKSNEAESLKRLNQFDYVVNDSDDDYPRYRGVGVACERVFKGGIYVIAPTTGIFNQIDDYDGTAAKLGREKLRERFEKLFDYVQSKEASPLAWTPSRRVRLLHDAKVADLTFELEFIGFDLLRQLVEVDDKLFAKKQSESDGLNWSPSRGLASLFRRETIDSEARQLLEGMSFDERAECLALVYSGRGHWPASSLKELTSKNLSSKHSVDYLEEKFGNGYLRKALLHFGYDVP
ncbi:serine/threonine protein kinase [Rhodoferax sp.]|uniref:serine/threonine protein kinase n=1 Tax=Rhodoferax sp. TaxID=50421 RepID=UPI00374DA85D